MEDKSLSQQFQDRIIELQLQDNAQQQAIVKKLEANLSKLNSFINTSKIKQWWLRQRHQQPQGIYLYGTVGTGKTMLMQMFFDNINTTAKYRSHFHQFIQRLHQAINQHDHNRQRHSVKHFAKELASQYRVIWLDELYIADIADFMLLSQVFRKLTKAGVALYFTSNRALDQLYREQLWQEHFNNFAQQLSPHLEQLSLDTEDFRRLQLSNIDDMYFITKQANTASQLEKIITTLTAGIDLSPINIEVNTSRHITLKAAANNILVTNFNELCGQDFGIIDYQAICQQFRAVVITNIPNLLRTIETKLNDSPC